MKMIKIRFKPFKPIRRSYPTVRDLFKSINFPKDLSSTFVWNYPGISGLLINDLKATTFGSIEYSIELL